MEDCYGIRFLCSGSVDILYEHIYTVYHYGMTNDRVYFLKWQLDSLKFTVRLWFVHLSQGLYNHEG